MISHIHSHYIIIIIITVTQKGVTDVYNIWLDSSDMAASVCVSTTCWRKPHVQSTSMSLPAQAVVWLAGIPGGRTIADVQRWKLCKGDAAIICCRMCKMLQSPSGEIKSLNVTSERKQWASKLFIVMSARRGISPDNVQLAAAVVFFSHWRNVKEGEGRRKEERKMNVVMSAQPTSI